EIDHAVIHRVWIGGHAMEVSREKSLAVGVGYGKERCCPRAPRIAIDQTADTSKRLGQNQPRGDRIDHLERRQLVVEAKEQDREKSADDRAVNRKSALLKGKDAKRVVQMIDRAIHQEEDARASDATGDGPVDHAVPVFQRNMFSQKFAAR